MRPDRGHSQSHIALNRAWLVVAWLAATGLLACSPIPVIVHGSHRVRVVDADTGEPIEGAGALVTWSVCNWPSTSSQIVGAVGASSDARGEFRIPVRFEPGFRPIFSFSCNETLYLFKSGGWISPTPAFEGKDFKNTPFGLEEAKDGALLIKMKRIDPDDRRGRREAYGELHIPSLEIPEAARQDIWRELRNEYQELFR